MLEILQLKSWVRDMGLEYVDWKKVFKIMYGGFTKNFKLIQFQYKLLMRISTCRYMRYKMLIDRDSPNCVFCPLEMETLVHIFLKCPITTGMLLHLEQCIINKLLNNYSDPNRLFYITCCHDNQIINYIWAAFKLYVSHCFQTFEEPSITAFKNYASKLLCGEHITIINNVKLVLGLSN